MRTKTYHQFCPLAYSLDIIGDRWNLLILRELLFGPRRFTDIQRGLPGIGTNLLSQRLKDLEALNIIAQRRLPPPAAVMVYEMTLYGETLRPVMGAIVKWGLHLMPNAPMQEDFLGVIPMMQALKILYKKDSQLTGVFEFHSFEEVFHIDFEPGSIQPKQGNAPQPDCIIEGDPKAIIMLAAAYLPLDQLLNADMIKIVSGDRALVEEFAGSFNHPEAVDA